MTAEIIDAKLREDWRTEQVLGWHLDENEELLSHESIYLHIWVDKQLDGIRTNTFVVKGRI